MGTCLFFLTLFYAISIVLCNLFINIHEAKEKCLHYVYVNKLFHKLFLLFCKQI